MRWPGLRIVDGPPLPIVSGVAVFAANIGVPLRLAENGAAEFPWEVDIELDSWPSTSARSIVASDAGWVGDGVDVGSGVVSAGKWTLALEDDVGALVGLKRFRGQAFARPLGLRRRGRTTAVWMMVEDPLSWGLLDDEGFHRVPRLVGAPFALAQSASIDPPLAKAIAVACDTRGAPRVLGFDGRMGCTSPGTTRKQVFQQLVGGRAGDARALWNDTTAASVDDVAAFARALDPRGFAREEQLREECAIAAAVKT